MAKVIEIIDAPFSTDTPYILGVGDVFLGEIKSTEPISQIRPATFDTARMTPAFNGPTDVVAVTLEAGAYTFHFINADANEGSLPGYLMTMFAEGEELGTSSNGAFLTGDGTASGPVTISTQLDAGTYYFGFSGHTEDQTGTYQFAVTERGATPNFSLEGEFVPGTSAAETLEGTENDDRLVALQGDDRLDGGAGSDDLSGGEGMDTAVLSGDAQSHTVEFLADGTIRIFDRGNDFDVDTLSSIEIVEFETGDDLNLQAILGILDNSEAEFDQLIEMYIAYFNRAPDAAGLYFWGSVFADGLDIEEIAALFLDQDETRATYPESDTNLEFATQVYSNVLGRTPDSAGLTFWQEQLDNGAIGRDTFILEVLRGAKADAPDDATPEFVALQEADQFYLNTKTDIGTYYAATLGMSDVDAASDAMALFVRGDATSVTAAQENIDEAHADLLEASNGGLLLPLVGVIDDPFAI
ncbi:MAG: DUF4214 domain-containing protein [Sulfitobacter sp.]